jgi:hypothetical protein
MHLRLLVDPSACLVLDSKLLEENTIVTLTSRLPLPVTGIVWISRDRSESYRLESHLTVSVV